MSGWRETSVTTKLMVLFTVVFFVSIGLCGLTLHSGIGGEEAGVIEIVLMLASVAGMVITLIVALIANAITGGKGKPQTLFGDGDEKK